MKNNDTIDEIMKDIDNMPSLPVTVAKILEIANNTNATAKDLNKVISLDPVLVTKVLKLINSAYIGVPDKITSIVKAIIMLGINTIKNLALSSAIVPMVGHYVTSKKGKKLFNMEGFWKHCIGVGVTSKIIASKTGISNKLLEGYFICGIIHDIGKLVMSFNFPDEYLKAIRLSNEGKFPLIDSEEEIFGTNHCSVGYELAKKWKLTDDLKEVILYHHNPLKANKENKNMVYITYSADTFCNQNQIGFAGNLMPGNIMPEVLKELNLKEETLYDNETYIEEEIKKASIFIKIDK
jgi:putative nucleotidyltransferase with HDIG domain